MSHGSFDDTHAHYTHDRTDTSTATPNAPRVPPTASFVDHTYPTTSCADQSHSSTVLTSPAPPVGSVLVGLVAHPPRSAVFGPLTAVSDPPRPVSLAQVPDRCVGGIQGLSLTCCSPQAHPASQTLRHALTPHTAKIGSFLAAAALKGAASGQSSRKQVGGTTGGPHVTYSATWCLSYIHLKSRWVALGRSRTESY